MVPRGSRLTFRVTGDVDAARGLFQYNTSAEFRSAVSLSLANGGVETQSLVIDSDESWSDPIIGGTWGYSATVGVRTLSDHAAPADVKAIVNGAFWRAAGLMPVTTDGAYSQPGSSVKPPGGGLLPALFGGTGLERGVFFAGVAVVAVLLLSKKVI